MDNNHRRISDIKRLRSKARKYNIPIERWQTKDILKQRIKDYERAHVQHLDYTTLKQKARKYGLNIIRGENRESLENRIIQYKKLNTSKSKTFRKAKELGFGSDDTRDYNTEFANAPMDDLFEFVQENRTAPRRRLDREQRRMLDLIQEGEAIENHMRQVTERMNDINAELADPDVFGNEKMTEVNEMPHFVSRGPRYSRMKDMHNLVNKGKEFHNKPQEELKKLRDKYKIQIPDLDEVFSVNLIFQPSTDASDIAKLVALSVLKTLSKHPHDSYRVQFWFHFMNTYKVEKIKDIPRVFRHNDIEEDEILDHLIWIAAEEFNFENKGGYDDIILTSPIYRVEIVYEKLEGLGSQTDICYPLNGIKHYNGKVGADNLIWYSPENRSSCLSLCIKKWLEINGQHQLIDTNHQSYRTLDDVNKISKELEIPINVYECETDRDIWGMRAFRPVQNSGSKESDRRITLLLHANHYILIAKHYIMDYGRCSKCMKVFSSVEKHHKNNKRCAEKKKYWNEKLKTKHSEDNTLVLLKTEEDVDEYECLSDADKVKSDRWKNLLVYETKKIAEYHNSKYQKRKNIIWETLTLSDSTGLNQTALNSNNDVYELRKHYQQKYNIDIFKHRRISDIALNVWLNQYQRGESCKIMDEDIERIIHKHHCYTSGVRISQSESKIDADNQSLVMLDVVSLYPSVMNNKYPTGEYYICYDNSDLNTTNITFWLGFGGPAQSKLNRTPLNSVEHDVKDVHIDKDHPLIYWKSSDYIFKDYIEHFYTLKHNAKTPQERSIAKNFLNFLYGSLMKHPRYWRTAKVHNSEEWKKIKATSIEYKQRTIKSGSQNLNQTSPYLLMKYKDAKDKYAPNYVHLSAFILAWARQKMNNLICMIGPNWYYSATDSLLIDNIAFENIKRQQLFKQELGCLWWDKGCEDFYITDYKAKAKNRYYLKGLCNGAEKVITRGLPF